MKPTTQLSLAAAAALALLVSCAPAQKSSPRPQRAYDSAPAPSEKPALRKTKPYTVLGVTYYPLEDAVGFRQTGVASWYGRDFHGKKTANGETYNMRDMTAAHKTLPLGSMVEVKRVDDGRAIVARINDRGPFVSARIIDLSLAGAEKLGIVEEGTAMVTVTALAEGRPAGGDAAPVAVAPLPDFSRGIFWVQVGAFGVRANAERVRERLLFPREKVRLQPFQNNAGESLTRVRVGPFEEMDAANNALREAAAAGFDASFVVAD